MPTAILTSLNTPRGAKPADRVGTVPERLTMEARGTGPTRRQTVPDRLQVLVKTSTMPWRAIRGLTWNQIDQAIDGEDSTATLSMPVLDLRAQQGNAAPRPQPPQHMAYFLGVIGPASLVRIVVAGRSKPAASPAIVHEGYPMVDSVVWSPRQQSLRFTSLSAGQEYLRTHERSQITGRYMRGRPTEDWDSEQPDATLVTALAPSFNPQGKPNRSADPYPMKTGVDSNGQSVTEPIHLWTTDGAPGAQHWTYWQALRTLLYFWVARHGDALVDAHKSLLDTTGLASTAPNSAADPFDSLGTQLVNDLQVQGTTVDAALALLCDAAGLHYEIALETVSTGSLWFQINSNHYVRIWAGLNDAAALQATPAINRNMGTPAVHDFPRDAPWQPYGTTTPASDIADANAAQHANLTIDNRDISHVHVVGGTPEWEGSFLLRPGWLPFEHLDNLILDEDKQAAKNWWDDQFPPEPYEETGRVPSSVHHGQHPHHSPHADLMRLWVFPDSIEYYGQGYGRAVGPFGEAKYDPYRNRETAPEGDPVTNPADWRLWYEDWTWGGGFPPGSTAWNVPGCSYWIPRRRPFRNTIGRFSTATADVSPIVRIHFGVRDEEGNLVIDPETELPQVPAPDDAAWVPYIDQPDIDLDRAAVRLTADNPHNSPAFQEHPGNPYGTGTGGLATRAYIDGHFWVQVTAGVSGDRRMTAARSVAGATHPRVRHRMLDTGMDQYVWRRRRGSQAGNSFLWAMQEYAQAHYTVHWPVDDAAYENRDDDDRLYKLAGQMIKGLSGETVAGDFTAWFRTDQYRVGDSFSGCAGMGFAWKRYPGIVRVQWINAGSVRTRVILSDLRNHPEVGAE